SVVERFIRWCHPDLSSEHLQPLPGDIHAVGIEDCNYPNCACFLQSCPPLLDIVVMRRKWPRNFGRGTAIEHYGNLALKIQALQIVVSLFWNVESPTNKY